MKFLITGVSGFVGEELVYFLQKNPKYSILGIDKNEELFTQKIIFRKCNLISEKSKLNDIFNEFKPDVVIHCAAKILDTYDKNLVWKTNYYATKDLIEICAVHRVKKFIFTSSMNVYGQVQDKPINEDCLVNPESFYAVGKIASENYIKIFSDLGLNSTILRLFNVYGPGQNLENLKQGMLSIYSIN